MNDLNVTAFAEAPGASHPEMAGCPHPYERAPAIRGGITRLIAPSARLVGIVRGLIHRDMRSVSGLNPAHLLTHYCVTPAASLSWYTHGAGGFVQEHPRDSTSGLWTPMPATLLASGVPTEPSVTWMPEPGAGYMVVLWPDAFKRVFGLAADVFDGQTVDAFQHLPVQWHSRLGELLEARNPEQVMGTLEKLLTTPPRPPLNAAYSEWQVVARQGRAWLEHVALRASDLRGASNNAHTRLSDRQIERRIKAFTGKSMRQWKSLIRDEAAFHLAAERGSQGQARSLSDLALAAGYSDQAHMSRVVKRLTGFSPAEFTQRYRDDESFWLFRLWGG